MLFSINRSTQLRFSAWVCLWTYLLCASGLFSWGGALVSVAEGSHQLSIRSTDQQWIIVLEHEPDASGLPNHVHQHSFLTEVITSFSLQQQDTPDHCLASQKCQVVWQEITKLVPEPPLLIGDYCLQLESCFGDGDLETNFDLRSDTDSTPPQCFMQRQLNTIRLLI